MNIINSLAPLAEQLGMLNYVIFFVVLFFESLVFVGLIIPGAPITVIAGFFAREGDLNVVAVMLLIIIAACLGDYCSYILGTKGTHFFKEEAKILKRAHLERAERFFHKHGGKGILIARFYPLRPVIPFVAGLSKMEKKRFIFWDTLSVAAWVVLYFSLGYFFSGALRKIEVWSERASSVLLIGTVLCFVLYFAFQKIRKHRKKLEGDGV